MKIRKTLLSLALSGAMVFGLLPGMTMTALADTSTYTLTIPSTLSVANIGWNATDGISATGTLESGKKLIVSASSDNGFALVNQTDSTQKVGYKLATASTDTEATTSWEFTALTNTATPKPMGIIVDDYSSMPAGTYQDTVTFTAKVENAVTTRTVTFNTATDGNTINKDGVTCSDSFDGYVNLSGFGSPRFSVSSGQFTKIEVTADDVLFIGINMWTDEPIAGWSTTGRSNATWTGKSSTVLFGGINGNEEPVTIVFTIEE